MRLVKIGSRGELSLTQNLIEDIPRYAILSHTWGADDDEVTFNDLQNGSGKSKAGYIKIQFCGEQAHKDGLQYFWVDTCCIDKANHTEFSEAIASMFRWYRHAVICYVYLSDVSARKRDNSQSGRTWESAFRKSRWFTRGWTLQELIAPKLVEFYSREGDRLGDRNSLEQEIHEITEIPIAALRGAPLSDFSVDRRMRWTEKRKTKRKEDKAYCLLGIFDVFIPLIYGEGENAFIRLKEEIDRSSRKSLKLDLRKIPYAKGAMYNSYEDDDITCHPATRVDLLHQIQDWAQQLRSKSIFWLSGAAGTGKSTVSRTFAKWLTEQDHLGSVVLGASFFFKRGEGDRGNASRFFPTVVRDLVLKIPGLDSLIAEVIDSDPSIFDKALGEQFDKLIYHPLQKVNLNTGGCSIFIVVVDALDECEKARDIKAIIDLWSRLPYITTIHLRLFITSRPDVPILQGIKTVPIDTYQDIVLHEEVPRATIQNDILVFLEDEFSKIRENYNRDRPSSIALNPDWPGRGSLQALADMAVPLFIVAATVCRFLSDLNWNPRTRLEKLLESKGIGATSQMEQTYLPVLRQLSATLSDPRDAEPLYQEFRTIVGSIVVLAEPLSIASLSDLLQVSQGNIWDRIHPLRSVLRVPADFATPIRTLHLSFSEFLLGDKLRDQSFRVDGPGTHQMLLTKCLALLSGTNGLRENLCSLSYPGQSRREIDSTIIDQRLSPAFQYACRYWVHHVQHSIVRIHDDDIVHVFLRRHFLHWLEALSLMNRIAEVIGQVSVLQSLTSKSDSTHLSSFLDDARRVVLINRYIADIAPLQIYSSAMVFAPQTSIVRKICGRFPAWIRRCPITPTMWGPKLQTLEGHTDPVFAVTFSPNGLLLASASYDKTVRLWNPTTGQEVQTLEGHTSHVNAVTFSSDGSLLASASGDMTVRLWNPATGQEVQKLEGHTKSVETVAFSSDCSFLASASEDETLRLWNPATGQEVQRLEGHTSFLEAVAFSPDDSLFASASHDQTVRLWNPTTGQEVQRLEHTDSVLAVAFSYNGLLLASASYDGTVRLWNLTTGQEVQTLEGHTGYVTAVAFSSDSSLLASASEDETVRLWNPMTGRELQTLKGHTQCVNAVAFSSDGSLLASASYDKTVRLWNPTTGQEVPQGHSDHVISVAFSSNGSLLASTSEDRTVRLWNPTTGQEVQTLKGDISPLTRVIFSSNCSLIATTSYDQPIRLWNPTTGQEVQKLERHTKSEYAVSFSSDGSLLASVPDDATVRLWNPMTNRELQTLKGHTSWVSAVTFSSDSSLLASASHDQTVRLWNPTTGQEVQRLEGHTDSVFAVAFSHNGLLLASASYDKTIRLWNPTTGQEVQTLKGHTSLVEAVAFSSDGSLLASMSTDNTIKLWNPTTGQEVQKFDYEPGSWTRTISFTSDSKTLLVDRGALSLNNESNTRRSFAPTTIMIRNDWVQQGDYNLLWLPHEYRNVCSAFYGNTFALGLRSGQVSFIQLD
ncbi:uncharacterized protein Z518_03581 [Rhinocladiella mackenziei CBS 650.93]|uniref:Vegetative incompatibility protein HET-E-1 n=1 Tax=Rhinocladiella mackenziei CBS 650.93 TaxID=1442369 RepID=A0A0D2IIP2_9EURO|nr:uncharacterized protein Z518_03581 [Rhinocladiella mackenziei CBS 650.93]KIX05609.1 hypothetical protein Z518_03581 [Rhinocladiella mackenziei CBS 650.93]